MRGRKGSKWRVLLAHVRMDLVMSIRGGLEPELAYEFKWLIQPSGK